MSRIVVVCVFGVVTALLSFAMCIHSAPLDPSIPAIQFSFSQEAFNAVLAQWQIGGVALFKKHLLIDFPFLLSYGIFGYLLVRHSFMATRLSSTAKSLLCWTLPCAALMDAGENLLHLSFVDTQAALPAVLYLLAGVFAATKWTLVFAFAVGVAYAIIRKRVVTREASWLTADHEREES